MAIDPNQLPNHDTKADPFAQPPRPETQGQVGHSGKLPGELQERPVEEVSHPLAEDRLETPDDARALLIGPTLPVPKEVRTAPHLPKETKSKEEKGIFGRFWKPLAVGGLVLSATAGAFLVGRDSGGEEATPVTSARPVVTTPTTTAVPTPETTAAPVVTTAVETTPAGPTTTASLEDLESITPRTDHIVVSQVRALAVDLTTTHNQEAFEEMARQISENGSFGFTKNSQAHLDLTFGGYAIAAENSQVMLNDYVLPQQQRVPGAEFGWKLEPLSDYVINPDGTISVEMQEFVNSSGNVNDASWESRGIDQYDFERTTVEVLLNNDGDTRTVEVWQWVG